MRPNYDRQPLQPLELAIHGGQNPIDMMQAQEATILWRGLRFDSSNDLISAFRVALRIMHVDVPGWKGEFVEPEK